MAPAKRKAKTKTRIKAKAKAKAKTKTRIKRKTKTASGKPSGKKKPVRSSAVAKAKSNGPKAVMKTKKQTSARPDAEALEKQLEKMLHVEPGPPAGTIPPVEEPAPQEVAVGVITHYYSHLGVAVVQINQGHLKAGDEVRIKGHTTDLRQQILSMEYEHQHVEQADPGISVGVKVAEPVREHDIVYVLR